MAHRDNFPSNELNEIAAGSVVNSTNNGYASRNKLRSFFGRANYNFDNRYLTEDNIRYAGSSRFPKEGRWGLFPGFSAAWRISQENFFSEAVPTIPSKDITWETTRVADVGVDLVVWGGKIAITEDYYNRLTYDILYGLSRSYMLGVDASPVNTGEVENRGWDLSLTYKNSFGDFSRCYRQSRNKP